MQAILLEKPFQFAAVAIPEPARPGPGDALVRVHCVGICGTDYSGYQGKMPFYSYPRIPGHELGVEILAVGDGVTNVKPGERCSVEPYINDPDSYASKRGQSNCCPSLQVLGVHTDGGLRPRFILPARKLHPSARLTLEQLALVETLAIGCHAVNRGNPGPNDNVLIIGAGPIGLSVIEFVKLCGARVIVMDMNRQRLDFCRQAMGVADTILSTGDGSELRALEELTDGNLAEVVFDATGSDKSMSRALEYVAFAGRLVFVGITTQEIRFAHPLMHRRELTLLASRNALPADFTRIIGLIEQGRIDTRPWITHRAAFTDMIELFPRWLQPETGTVKAMVLVSD
ncbi:MAG: zinc-binding alcohol dehydrogenase family protein [Planctomycetes bacterium]|nr:zinc-binding alcohol dehydrogenase family protein [Planctomycetota bacterium]